MPLPQAHFMFWSAENSRCGVVFYDGDHTDFTNTNVAFEALPDLVWTRPKPITPNSTTWAGFVDCAEDDLEKIVPKMRRILQPRLKVTITELKFQVHYCGIGDHTHGRANKVYPSFMPGMQPIRSLTYAENLRRGLNGLDWAQYIFPSGHDKHESAKLDGISKATDWLADPDHMSTHVQSMNLTPKYCCV